MKMNITLIYGRLCGWMLDNSAFVRASFPSVITAAGGARPFLPYPCGMQDLTPQAGDVSIPAGYEPCVCLKPMEVGHEHLAKGAGANLKEMCQVCGAWCFIRLAVGRGSKTTGGMPICRFQ